MPHFFFTSLISEGSSLIQPTRGKQVYSVITLKISDSFYSRLEHKTWSWKISQKRTVTLAYIKLERNTFFDTLFFPFLSLIVSDLDRRNIPI